MRSALYQNLFKNLYQLVYVSPPILINFFFFYIFSIFFQKNFEYDILNFWKKMKFFLTYLTIFYNILILFFFLFFLKSWIFEILESALYQNHQKINIWKTSFTTLYTFFFNFFFNFCQFDSFGHCIFFFYNFLLPIIFGTWHSKLY